MHSLQYMGLVLVGSAWAGVLPPAITPAPALMEKRDGPDAASLALVLITAVPEDIREVAATNIGAASSILWSEFLGGNRPSWFTSLPEDIQTYLVDTFGPKTAAPPEGSSMPIIFPSVTESAPSSTFDDGQWHPSSSAAPTTQDTESSAVSSPTGSPTESGQSTETDSASNTVSQTPSASRSPASTLVTSGITLSTQKTAPSATSTKVPPAPLSAEQEKEGLSKSQKIGIGVGVPFGIAAAAAVLFACCLLLRRRKRKSVDGSIPPSSPGFIPRFSFQEKTDEQRPLNYNSGNVHSDWSNSAWDDDVVEPTPDRPLSQNNIQHQQWPGTQQQQQPAFAPVLAPLLHTHSSNKARGKRTSYSSLHSVAELSEPDDIESPVLGREAHARNSPPRQPAARRPSVIIHPIPEAAQVKRKPLASPPSQSPAAEIASQALPWQPQNHSPNRFGNRTSITAGSPVSPVDGGNHFAQNPFSNKSPYVEDYGPEYNGDYVDAVENDMFGGHTSLSRYPEPKEWPLRGSPRGHRRTRSPMWDRVYEGGVV